MHYAFYLTDITLICKQQIGQEIMLLFKAIFTFAEIF